MIVSEKSYQNNSDYVQFVIKNRFEVDKKGIISSKKWLIQVIISIIVLTRSSERIFNPMRYTGYTV